MLSFILAAALVAVVGFLGGSIPSAQESEGGGPAKGYEEAPVPDGGTVSGKVTFKGTVPPAKVVDLAKFPNPGFCSKVSNGKGSRVIQEVKVKDGALQDVVVYIDGIMKGKPFKFNGTDVKADTCQFLVQGGPSTFAGVVMKKTDFRVENMDADPSDPKAVTGVLHNPHTYEVFGTNNITMFNVPLAEKGQVINKKVILRKKDSIMKLECDQHNFMQAFFQPVSNPYYAVVGPDGSFTIDQVPPGDYEIEAWHPILGEVEQKITVPAKGKVTTNFAFAK
jgi:hypothetical protein